MSNRGKMALAQLYYLAHSLGFHCNVRNGRKLQDIIMFTFAQPCCDDFHDTVNDKYLRPIGNIRHIFCDLGHIYGNECFVYDVITPVGNYVAGIGQILVPCQS